jgi:hypothetical protein
MRKKVDRDEWPPPYEYVGTPNAWNRITRDVGDPIPHRHACPECYEQKPCTQPCTLEPDLEGEDGTPYGSHMLCSACDAKYTAIETAILAGDGPSAEVEMDYSNQLELDLGA